MTRMIHSIAKMTCPMKQFFSYLGASLAAIAALASCNKEIEAPVEDIKGGVPFEICASAVDTKTAIDGFDTKWVADDAINLFHAEAGSKTYTSDGQFTITAENLAANKFTGTLAAELVAGSYDWYAIYPYKEEISSPGEQTDGFVYIGHSVAANQNGNNSKAHLCKTLCPLYGVSKSVEAIKPVSLEMKHLTSVVEINVTNSNDEPLTVSNISISTDEDIVGSYYINFAGENVVYNPSANYVKTVANLIVNNGTALAKNETASFYIPIKPHVAENGSVITITVNGYEKTISLTKDVTFIAGKIKKINFAYDYVPTLDTFTAINDISKLSDGASLLIVGKSGDKYYQLPVNPTVSSGKVAGVEVAVTDNTIQADATSAWKATKSGDYWQLSSVGKNIYHSNGGASGTNLAYGSSTAYPWSITNHSSDNRTFKLAGVTFSNNTPTVNSRGMLMSGTTFGGYALTNISKDGYSAIMLFVKEEAHSTDPAIIANDITEVSARGESAAVLTYSIENPIEGTSVSAICDGTIVTEVVEDGNTFLYSVSANTTTSSREGSITLTYGDVTKVIKVSQLAPVFKVSRTEVELEAAANSSATITVTSDFDWTSVISTGAGFSSTPTTCEWNTENQFTDGKTTVTITASAANESEEGTKTLGTLTFTNSKTSETLVVTVTQKSSYEAPSTGTTISTTISDYISSHSGITVSSGNTVNSIVKELTLDSNITVSAVGTGNTGSFWGTSPNNDWRIYSKSGDEGTVTISASNSKTITSIKVTFSTSNGGGLKLNGTALTSGTAVTVNTSSVSLSVPYSGTKTGQARITAIEVSYN